MTYCYYTRFRVKIDRRFLIETLFFMMKGKKMSWLEKVGKKIISAVTNPKNLINPLFSVTEFGKSFYDDHQEAKQLQKAQEQAQIDASNQKFYNDIEQKRKGSKKSNVIFAGVLGANKTIGLGGQKSLLGL